MPLNFDLHSVRKIRSGEDLSHSRRLGAPPTCRPHVVGLPVKKRSSGYAPIVGVRKQHLGAGGGVVLQASGALQSKIGDQSNRGLGRGFRQGSAMVGGSFISDRQIAHSQRYEPVTSKEKATRQDRGGRQRTRRNHRRGSRQRAQAVIDLVSKRKASATR